MDKIVAQNIIRESNIAYVLTNYKLYITELYTPIPGYDSPNSAAYVGSPITDLFPELFGYEEILQGIIAGQVPRLKLERINRETKDEGIIYVDFTDLPLHDRDGNIVGLIHLVKDVTHLGMLMQRAIQRGNELDLLRAELEKANAEQRRLEARLREYNLNLEQLVEERTAALQTAQKKLLHSEKLASMGRLSASVAHEISNYVGGINSSIGLLMMEEDHDSVLDIAQRQAERLVSLVERLRRFSKPAETDYNPFSLHQTVHNLMPLVEKRLYHADIELNLDLLAENDIAYGSDGQLEEVLMNLIINAIDAMPRSGELTIATRNEDRFLIITVADTGTGIVPENMEKIFEPFFTTKGEDGTGLGLNVSRTIVQEHGGELLVESEVGKGTRFTIELPISAS